MGAGVRRTDGLSHPALTLIHLRAGFHIWTVCLRLLIAGSLWHDKDTGGEKKKLLTCRVAVSALSQREKEGSARRLLLKFARNFFLLQVMFFFINFFSFLFFYTSEIK